MGESLIKVDDLYEVPSLKRNYFNHKIQLSNLFQRITVRDRDKYLKNKRAGYNIRKDCVNYISGLYPVLELHMPEQDLVKVVGVAHFDEGKEGALTVVFMYPMTSDEAFSKCTKRDIMENYVEFFNRFVFEDVFDFETYLKDNADVYGDENCEKIYSKISSKIMSKKYDVKEVEVIVCHNPSIKKLDSKTVNITTDSVTE